MWAHLGVCGFIPSLSYILRSMKCDFWASFLAPTFSSPWFGHKPKAGYDILNNGFNMLKVNN
jgi:hypothetical protein